MRRDRIEARLNELGINQFEAAKRAGKGTHFLYDFFIGRKKSFKGDGPERLAHALECSTSYLTGESEVIGSPPTGLLLPATQSNGGLSFAGVVEAGVFRKVQNLHFPAENIPIAPSPRFPAERQIAYIVRGTGLSARGIAEGAVLCAVKAEEAKEINNGAIAIVEHLRLEGSEIEISAREVQHFPNRTEYRSLSASEEISPIVVRDGKTAEPDGKARVVALVISATLLL